MQCNRSVEITLEPQGNGTRYDDASHTSNLDFFQTSATERESSAAPSQSEALVKKSGLDKRAEEVPTAAPHHAVDQSNRVTLSYSTPGGGIQALDKILMLEGTIVPIKLHRSNRSFGSWRTPFLVQWRRISRPCQFCMHLRAGDECGSARPRTFWVAEEILPFDGAPGDETTVHQVEMHVGPITDLSQIDITTCTF